ncbi:NYN domain-containing protein [Alicyclobacillus fodiniaquatilis]|jgi:predicted RNA-binding protein with PIN domain|uniref:NYN domain-containing protein n=1 Tax=Alicyclobacillus fodiniaquatilis TaxID=1661150 RepID=A0ABW4JA04_9BACL
MKSSARERKRKGQRCLIVDGYNVLARSAGTSLSKIPDLERARLDMEDQLAQYRSVYDEDVVVVYDAHHRPGVGGTERRGGIEIIFTSSGETADARIERLVYEIRDDYRDITVATSDAAEQQVSFGGGALRISANELLRRLENMRNFISRQTAAHQTEPRHTLGDSIRGDIAKALEKWRRK